MFINKPDTFVLVLQLERLREGLLSAAGLPEENVGEVVLSGGCSEKD